MYLLDTNVISELRKAKAGRANPGVAHWAAGVLPASLYLSIISVLELDMGIMAKEPHDAVQGKILRTWLEGHVLPAFEGRTLPIDIEVARTCARLHIPDRKPERDALIAATAMVHGLIIVTRNESDFHSLGVRIHNPWAG